MFLHVDKGSLTDDLVIRRNLLPLENLVLYGGCLCAGNDRLCRRLLVAIRKPLGTLNLGLEAQLVVSYLPLFLFILLLSRSTTLRLVVACRVQLGLRVGAAFEKICVGLLIHRPRVGLILRRLGVLQGDWWLINIGSAAWTLKPARPIGCVRL